MFAYIGISAVAVPYRVATSCQSSTSLAMVSWLHECDATVLRK